MHVRGDIDPDPETPKMIRGDNIRRLNSDELQGCRINRDYARQGWATETGHPNWGLRDPSQVNDSNRQGRHQGLSLGLRSFIE